MNDQLTAVEYILWACAILFGIWPILYLNLVRRNNRLRNLLVTWTLFDLIRLVTFFDTVARDPLLIPEPLSTSLFFATGLILMVFYFAHLAQDRPHPDIPLSKARRINHLYRLNRADFLEMVVTLLTDVGHDAEIAEPNSLHVDISLRTIKGDLCLVRCITDEDPVNLSTVIDTTSAYARVPGAKVMLATPYEFSEEARDWAKHNAILLYNGKRLWALWEDYLSRR